MFIIFKINIINLFLYLSLAELYSTPISDYGKDSSTNNHNNIKYLYVNTDQSNASEQFYKQKVNGRGSSEQAKNTTTYNAGSVILDTEEKILENSLFRLKREEEEHRCLLDSLKRALIWWSHSNGTLMEANNHVFKPQQQLDLSYHDLSKDEEALKIILKNFHNATIVAFSLAYNNFTAVPFHSLQMMANSLKYLSLMGNPFIGLKISETDRNIPHCILNENDLNFFKNHDLTSYIATHKKEIAWATFPDMPALRELDISNCDIEYIEKAAFQNLTNLKNLYMSHNKILNIPANTFLYTPALQVLDLSFTNVYDSIVSNILVSPNMESLMKLFYGVNIEQQIFKYLPNLIYLDLSHTKLRSSSAVAFTNTGPNLKYLSLCFTSFPVFGNGVLRNSSLIGLDLSGNANAAFSLTEEVFAGLSQSLNFLFFEKANLRDLSWLKPLQNLRFLALSGNNINNLLAEHFRPLKQLQILDLSSNQVSNWYSRVFRYNKKLRILSLRDNNINILTSEMLKDFSMLIYLSLGHNNFICDCILHDLVDVASINNKKAQCTGSFAQTIKDNIHIDSIYLPEILRNSKLFANTSLSSLDIPSVLISQNLYKFKQSVKKRTQRYKLQDRPRRTFILSALRSYNSSKTCLYEYNYTETFSRKINTSIFKLQLLDYKDEHYWCYNETRKENPRGLNCQRAYLIEDIEQELSTLAAYILGSVGSLILIFIIAIMVYIKRWHIYYYYSSLKSAALFSVFSKEKLNNFNDFCEQNPNMIYDIFISYCQNDRDWIVEELMPNVEETENISICLHERDFQIGVTILDNIVSCMERSKALMLIISSNFLLSHWCQFEMQLAHHHVLDLDKDNLILVFLEDIPRSKRPKNLQFLMDVKTYIKWPGGKSKIDLHPEERKLFWKRLKRTLRNIGLSASESKA